MKSYKEFTREILYLFLQINRLSPFDVTGKKYDERTDTYYIYTTRKTYKVSASAIDYLYSLERSDLCD